MDPLIASIIQNFPVAAGLVFAVVVLERRLGVMQKEASADREFMKLLILQLLEDQGVEPKVPPSQQNGTRP